MLIIKRIKDLREDYDLKQKELASKLGVAKSTYKNWEYGIYNIPLEKLNDFCEYFDVSLDYVCGLTDTKSYKTIHSNINRMIAGQNLKKIRKDHGDKQEFTAKIIGVKRAAYSKYEIGINLIPTIPLINFCKYYHVSMDYICGKIIKN